MKLRDFKLNNIPVECLSVFVDDKEVAMGFVGEVLQKIPHLMDCEIVSTNIYIDTFVIRLNS